MKKFLLFLFVIVLFTVLGLGIFLAAFDADRYRPQVVSQLERFLGRPVALERISLGWRNGVALQLRSLAVYEGREAAGEPLLQMESAGALVRLAPLLRKEVEISSIVLSGPRIHLARDVQGQINLAGLAAAVSPAASRQVGGEAPPGAARQTAPVAAGPVSLKIASLRIENGVLHWTDATTRPPTELWIKRLDVIVDHIVPGEPMDIEASGAFAGESPNAHLSGRLMLPDASHPGSLERVRLMVEGVPLETVMPPVPAGEPRLRGALTVALQGSASTLDPAALIRAASGSGQVKWDNPVVANLNVLRVIFEKLSMIPGLVQRLEARLPETYQAKLAVKDTVLEPVDLSVNLEGGLLRFHDVNVRTDTFGVSGSGTIGLDGAVNVTSILRIEPAFSSALIRSVNELQALTNAQGEMEIPVAFQGQAPRITPLPDLQYVASKVLVTKAVDLIGEWLKKRAPAEGEPGAADNTSPPSGNLLGQFLRRALGPDDSTEAPPASSQP